MYKEYAYQKWENIACETIMRERTQRWTEYVETRYYSNGMRYLEDIGKYIIGSKRFMEFIKY